MAFAEELPWAAGLHGIYSFGFDLGLGLGFEVKSVYTVCARWVLLFRNGGAPTYRALASACRPRPKHPNCSELMRVQGSCTSPTPCKG